MGLLDEILRSFGPLFLRMLVALSLAALAALSGRGLFGAITSEVRGPVTLRLAGTALGTAWVATTIFHILAWPGYFGLGPGATLLSLTAAVAWKRGAARRLAHEIHVARRWLTRTMRRRPAAWMAGGTVLLVFLRSLMLPPLAWDALTYHLTKAALYVQSGSAKLFEAPGGWSAFRLFPGGGEVLWAWAMLPVHGDVLVSAVDVMVWLIFGLAVYRLGREMGVAQGPAFVSAGFLLTVPNVLLAVGSNYVDTLGHLFGALGAGFVLRTLSRRQAVWLVPAGMAMGLAAGVKLTAGPLLVLVALAGMGAATSRGGRYLGVAVLGLALGAAVWLPWGIYSTAETGLPLSPFPVSLGGIRLGEGAAMSWFMEQFADRAYHWSDEWRAFTAFVYAPQRISLGGFPIVPMLLAPVGLVAWWRRDRAAAAFGLSLLLLAAALYMGPHFTAARLGWPASNGRYFLLAVALVTQLGFLALPGHAGAYSAYLLAGSFFNLWTNGALGWVPLEETTVLGQLALLVVVTLIFARARPRSTSGRVIASTLLVAAFLTEAGLLREGERYALLKDGMSLHPVPKYWVDAAAILDRRRKKYRVALTSGPIVRSDSWHAYPLLGSRLQNEIVYVPTALSGEVLAMNDPRFLTAADRGAWLARLSQQNVDAVMSFLPAGPELRWMEESPQQFARLAGDGKAWGLYAVARGSPP